MINRLSLSCIVLLSLQAFGQDGLDREFQEAGMFYQYSDSCANLEDDAVDGALLFELRLKKNGYSMLEKEFKKPDANGMAQIQLGQRFIEGYFEGVSSVKGDAEACKAIKRFLSKKKSS